MQLGQVPFIAWHLDGATAWIDLLFVPREQRHRGRGRAMVEGVLQVLPEWVREVEVLSAQLDEEFSPGFWAKLGFEPELELGEWLNGMYLRKTLGAGAAPADPRAATTDDAAPDAEPGAGGAPPVSP